jgi:hypothetical protein
VARFKLCFCKVVKERSKHAFSTFACYSVVGLKKVSGNMTV